MVVLFVFRAPCIVSVNLIAINVFVETRHLRFTKFHVDHLDVRRNKILCFFFVPVAFVFEKE